MNDKIFISPEDVLAAQALLKSVDETGIKTDKNGLKYDDQTGAIIGGDSKDVGKTLADTATKNNKPYILVGDSNHYDADVYKDFVKNAADFKRIVIELPEDRNIRQFGLKNTDGSEVTRLDQLSLKDVEENKERFLKNLSNAVMDAKGYKSHFTSAEEHKEYADKFAQNVYDAIYISKKNGVELVFSEPRLDAADVTSKNIHKLRERVEVNRDMRDNDRVEVYDEVRLHLRDKQLAGNLGPATDGNTPTLIVRGAHHLSSDNDLSERLGNDKSLIVFSVKESDLHSNHGKLPFSDNYDKSINYTATLLNRSAAQDQMGAESGIRNMRELVKDLGLGKPEIEVNGHTETKHPKYQIPDYIYVASENGKDGTLYEAKTLIKNNKDLYNFYSHNSDRFDEKSQEIIKEIVDEKKAEKEAGKLKKDSREL